MTGVEIAVGYVFAWLVAKARRVAGRADAEVDRGLDAGMDRLHELVSAKLGDDPALQRAGEEAEEGQGQPSERTRRRLADSLEDAAERDTAFAEALKQVVAEIQSASRETAEGGLVSGNTFLGPTAVQTGNRNRQDNRFGV
ncbi:hypothetical protein [Streptomyces sp. MBT62]|uniref:hypothetical protein n=1 Tax=Streptomyces sp. MBT62 TaxID=2800410 RepID=UPI00190E5BB9|nr:hypothetical protein [Streptomyces sp. MBT62]MBK3567378.1 hypothetical protein [Streptomyces sp. MBT62]